MKLVQLRVPEQLRRKVVTMVAFATAALPAACAASAETDEETGEGSEAAFTSEKADSATCDETINKVDDIRNRFLDARHSAVWAFQTDGRSAFEKLAEAPASFGTAQQKLLETLENVTFEAWTPSSKVRVRDARLAEQYLVVRGAEKTGGTKVVLLFDWKNGELLARARATKASIWSWSCPSPPRASGTPEACQEKAQPRWNNWPNWQNWTNWNNISTPCR